MKKQHDDLQSQLPKSGIQAELNRSHLILQAMPEGYVYCSIIYEHGRAVDFVHEEVNRAYGELTGLSNVIGRRLTEVMPGVDESNSEFFRRHLKVAETGVPDKFEVFLDPLGKWYRIAMYRPEKGYLISIFDDISESKNSDQALLSAKEHFEAVIKAANVGTWEWDIPSGRISFNQRVFDIVGYCRQELEPLSIRSWIDMQHPDEMEESRRLLQLHLDGESEDYSCEFRIRHKSGEWIWVLASGKVMARTPEGKPLRMVGTTTLINKRKRAEEELRESEQRFRALFNSQSSIQVLVVAEDGQILDVNEAAAEWYGWSVETMKTMFLRDVCTLSPEAVLESLAAVRIGQQNTLVSRHRRADHSVRDVEMFRCRLEIGGREVVHFIIIDITLRKAAEKALIESEARFKTMFENHSATMLIFDAQDGSIIDSNRSAAEYYGWSREELSRMNITQVNTLASELLQKEMASWISSNPVSRIYQHRRADGSIRDVEIFANRMMLNGRDVVYDIVHDVTDRKRTEIALLESETRFKALFNSQSGIQALIDPATGKIIDANQTAVNWYGWSLEEMKEMYAGDFNMMKPEEVRESLSQVSPLQPNIFYGRHRRADGSVRDVEVFRNKIEIEGKPVVHVITHDITERKESETALRESEARFRSMFEDHSAVMIVLDPETGNIVDANKAAARYYGWSADVLKHMHISALRVYS